MSGRIRASAFGLDRHTQTEREDAKADVDPAVVCKKHKVGLDMTKRSNFLLCCLALLAVTSGCAVQHPWTSGELSEPPPVAQYRIAFDATMPTEVYMEKMGSELQPPQFSDADRNAALAGSKALYSEFLARFSPRFKEQSRKYGMVVVDAPGPGVGRILLHVNMMGTSRTPTRDGPELGLQTKLQDDKGHTFWTYESLVGSSSLTAKIDDSLVDAYVDSLLNSMRKDRVIGSTHN